MARQFDLQGQLEGIYARFPEAAPMPVIGITGNYEDLTCKLGRGYYDSVVAAGGIVHSEKIGVTLCTKMRREPEDRFRFPPHL